MSCRNSGKDLPGLYQRRLQNVARKFVTLDESVEALAGVVAVKGDDAVEIELAELSLHDLDLRFRRAAPKLAIQVQPAAGPPGTFHIAPGIDHRVDEKP